MEKNVSLSFEEYAASLQSLNGSSVRDVYHLQDTTLCFELLTKNEEKWRLLVQGWWNVFSGQEIIGTSNITDAEEEDHGKYYSRLRAIAQKIAEEHTTIMSILIQKDVSVIHLSDELKIEIVPASTGYINLENVEENFYIIFQTEPEQKIFKSRNI